MTQSSSFFAPLSYKSDREIGLNMKESLAGVAVLGTLLAGCATTTTNTDTTVSTTMDQSSSANAMMQTSSSNEAMQRISSSAAMMKSSQAATSAPSSVAVHQEYKNGMFSAAGEYQAPSGKEEINVSLTLRNGVITDATYAGTAMQGRSKMMQEAFGAGYKQLVVGKSIDSLSLDVVNGSSLTPMGFMDAVKKIRMEAAAS